MPAEPSLNELHESANNGGPDPASALAWQQDEVHSASLATVDGYVVLHEADRPCALLDDEALHGWASPPDVLRRDLVVAQGVPAPPLIDTRIREECAQRREIGFSGRS